MAAVVVAAAGLVRGYGGFGGGLVAIPLLSLIYGPVEAYAITAIRSEERRVGNEC